MDNVDRWVGVVDNAELDGKRRDDTERVFVLWGSQPHSSKAAHGGHGLVDARSNLGVKSVVVDPYLTAEAAKADVWLPVRPGSDCALMLSWIRYIIDQKAYDEPFVKYWTNLPFLINPDTRLAYRAEEVWPIHGIQPPLIGRCLRYASLRLLRCAHEHHPALSLHGPRRQPGRSGRFRYGDGERKRG